MAENMIGRAVAFYPDEGDPGRENSTAVLARVTAVHENGVVDLEVDGVPVLGVPPTPPNEPLKPHTWTP